MIVPGIRLLMPVFYKLHPQNNNNICLHGYYTNQVTNYYITCFNETPVQLF